MVGTVPPGVPSGLVRVRIAPPEKVAVLPSIAATERTPLAVLGEPTM